MWDVFRDRSSPRFRARTTRPRSSLSSHAPGSSRCGGGTRVTLESVLWAHHGGATHGEIEQQFPSLSLADIDEAIAHDLRHQSELDRYLADQEQGRREVAERIRKQFPREGLRARLQARLER
jgi:uncharacterized protein (DUF433 family)